MTRRGIAVRDDYSDLTLRRLFVKTIGRDRARTKIGMANLVDNFRRYAFWKSRVGLT